MRQIRIDPDLEPRLRKEGFATVSVPDEVVTPLRDRVEELDRSASAGDGARVPPDSTFHHPDPAFRRNVMATVQALLLPQFDRYFAGHATLLGSYFIKRADGGEFGVHRDWTMTTDGREDVFNFWCPLVDIDVANGALAIFPGSHRLTHHVSGPGIAPYWNPYREKVKAGSVIVPVRFGEAIFFNNRLLHWSFPNRSGKPRPVAALTLIPEGATAALFRPTELDASRLEIVDMSPDGYIAEGMAGCMAGAPARPRVGTMPNPNRPIGWDEFQAAARAA